MPLQVDEAGGCHLRGSEDGHNLEYAIVEAGRQEGAARSALTTPEVGAAHEAGDVQYHDALQLGQGDTLAITLELHTLTEVSVIYDEIVFFTLRFHNCTGISRTFC